MASDQQEAWLIMPGKAGSNVMTGVNSLPNDETDAAELRKAQSFGSSASAEARFTSPIVFCYTSTGCKKVFAGTAYATSVAMATGWRAWMSLCTCTTNGLH